MFFIVQHFFQDIVERASSSALRSLILIYICTIYIFNVLGFLSHWTISFCVRLIRCTWNTNFYILQILTQIFVTTAFLVSLVFSFFSQDWLANLIDRTKVFLESPPLSRLLSVDDQFFLQVDISELQLLVLFLEIVNFLLACFIIFILLLIFKFSHLP